jgi:K+-transporting ATPase KdpF subunit
MPGSARKSAKCPRPTFTHSSMENLIIGLIAVLLLLYLVAAVLRPEKF